MRSMPLPATFSSSSYFSSADHYRCSKTTTKNAAEKEESARKGRGSRRRRQHCPTSSSISFLLFLLSCLLSFSVLSSRGAFTFAAAAADVTSPPSSSFSSQPKPGTNSSTHNGRINQTDAAAAVDAISIAEGKLAAVFLVLLCFLCSSIVTFQWRLLLFFAPHREKFFAFPSRQGKVKRMREVR